MAATGDEPRSGVSRRDALRLLAASTTTVAAGSMIISQPAQADSGSEPCRYDFDGSPQVAVRTINRNGNNRSDYLGITVSNVGGTCPCADPSGRPSSIEYAYFISIPDIGSGGLGWTSASSVSVGSPPVLWKNRGGSATISVGIRVTCEAAVGQAARCRFGTQTFTVARSTSDTTQSFGLGSGGSNPAGIPSCETSFMRAAPFSASGGLSIVGGPGNPPAFDPSEDDTGVDLGTPEAETTTTTTDKPGNGPKPGKGPESPSTSTTTTTTTSPPTSTTTTSPSSTTTGSSSSTTTTPPGS